MNDDGSDKGMQGAAVKAAAKPRWRKPALTAAAVLAAVALVLGGLWGWGRYQRSQVLAGCDADYGRAVQAYDAYAKTLKPAKALLDDASAQGAVSDAKLADAVRKDGTAPSGGDRSGLRRCGMDGTTQQARDNDAALRKAEKGFKDRARQAAAHQKALTDDMDATARKALDADIQAAGKLLDDSGGKVADDAVRRSLDDQLKQSRDLVAKQDKAKDQSKAKGQSKDQSKAKGRSGDQDAKRG